MNDPGRILKSLKVLLVEDNPGDIDLIRESVESDTTNSITLQTCSCLGDALKILETIKFDIILLDLGLPDSDGEESLKKMRAAVPEIPIIVLTGLQDPKLYEWCIKAGANDFLPKGLAGPFISQAVYNTAARVIALKRLHKNKRRLRHLISVNPGVIYVLFPETLEPKWVSPNIFDKFGYTPEQAVTPDWWTDHLHPQDRDRARKKSDDILTAGHLVHEYRFYKKNGDIAWIHDSVEVLADENGNPMEIVGLWIDITEHKQLQQKHENLQNELHKMQKMESIGNLAGGVAHDFNNILTTILGNADLILYDLKEDASFYDNIVEIKKAGQRAAELTRQLLTFSRKEIRTPVLMNLNANLKDMEKLLIRLVREDIKIIMIPGHELWEIYMDASQMDQIIMNLVVNAQDAMPDGGSITIETQNTELAPGYFQDHNAADMSGDYVMLSVTDTGIGMDKNVQDQMFDPFFTTKSRTTGTGLGLSTVYGIVKQNQGHIWCYSKPGQGTCMKVYLPRAEKDAETVSYGEQDEADTLTGTETILVVEDNELVRNLAVKALISYGYNVINACCSRDALKICTEFEGKIDLVLTDIIMPGMNGKELSEKINTMKPGVKVLFMSGYAQDVILQKGILPSKINFIQKPFFPKDLAKKVTEILKDTK